MYWERMSQAMAVKESSMNQKMLVPARKEMMRWL
jgi:hypothetical protein